MSKIFIIADGASSCNGRSAGIGVVIKDKDGKNIKSISKYIGNKTNNEAEYEAIIFGLEWARDNKLRDIVVLSDSNLVISQINGEYRVKTDSLEPYLERVQSLRTETTKFDFVPREYSHEADELARKASEEGLEKVIEKKYPFLTKQS